jgi:multicomponent Na+:H+ antiporter subunit D
MEIVWSMAPGLLVGAPLLGGAMAGLNTRGASFAVTGLFGIGAIGALAATLRALGHSDAGARAWGGLAADGVGAVIASLILTVASLTVAPAFAWARRHAAPRQAGLMIGLCCASVGGLIACVLATDLITAWLWLQQAALAALLAAGLDGHRDRRALTAALSGLVSIGVGAILFAIGAAIVADLAPGLDWRASLARQDGPSGAALGVGLALMMFGAVSFAGAAPGLLWSVLVFGRGAWPAAALVGAGFGLAGFVLAIRVIQLAGDMGPWAGYALAVFGAASATVAALRAAGARCLRRLTFHAFSAQIGIAAIGVALGGASAGAGLLHAAHGVALALCMTAGVGVIMGGGEGKGPAPLTGLDGLSQRAPLTSAALTLALLALVAAPLTGPFLTKWLIMEAAMDRGWAWAALALVFASLAGVLVAGRVIERIYFHEPQAHAFAIAPRQGWALAPALALGIVWLVVWGLDATSALAVAQALAGDVIGAGAQ